MNLTGLYKKFIYPRIKIDDRSLALFRILVGILIIIDVILRFRNLTYFYTDEGPVPTELIISDFNYISLLYVITDPIGVSIIFILQIILAIILIFGYKTKTVFLLSTILVLSVDLRNPYVASYADTLFRLLLFWALFLPLGNKWSIDAIQNTTNKSSSVLTHLAGFFILFQMLAMYIVNGSIKYTNAEQWLSGWAFHSILHYDRITWLFGPYVRESPELLIQFGSVYWFIMMLIAPLMLLFTKRLRYIISFILMFGHLNIALTTRVGAFSLVAIAGLCLFLPEQFWKDIYKIKNYVGIQNNKNYLIELSKFFPKFKIIKVDEVLKNIIVITAIIIVISAGFVMVVNTVDNSSYTDDRIELENNQYIDGYLSIFNVDQPSWGFYTSGRNTDTFYVFAAETESGEKIDIFNENENVSFERQYEHNLHEQFETYRYRFYYSSVGRSDDPNSSAASYLADYHCETYQKNNEQLKYISMYEVTEQWNKKTMGNLDEYETIRINLIHAHSCTDSKPEIIEKPDNLNSKPSNVK